MILWKICNNCLPVRSELQKRNNRTPGLCIFCNKEEETLEHLFLQCFARAVWFASDLTLRMECFITELTGFSKDLQSTEVSCFYCQFVFILLFICIHRNECSYEKTRPNPLKVTQLARISEAFSFNTPANKNIPQQPTRMARSSLEGYEPNLKNFWSVYLDIQRYHNLNRYGTNAMLREHGGTTIVLYQKHDRFIQMSCNCNNPSH